MFLFVLLLGMLLYSFQPSRPALAQAVNQDAELVYLDAQGYIRVYDPLHVNSPAVEWVSPVGGWTDFALGDFNGDGDREIVAVKGGEGSGQLTIYDPVIATGAIVPGQLINSIPWRVLYDSAIAGVPQLVTTGSLDAAVASDEIVYVTRLNTTDSDDSNQRSQIVLLRATESGGTAWARMADFTTSQSDFTQLAVGDLDRAAPDEISAVDKQGALTVYQLRNGVLTRILDNESSSRPWRAIRVVNFFSTGLPGLAASRSSSPGFHSFWVFVYDPGDDGIFRDEHSEYFLPAPEHLFAGDINGNGDEEIFFLRSVPSNITNIMRLVMRNRGTDQLPAFEQALDPDNGYQGGVAADVDGDGRAEVIVMRNNRIRTYTQPEVNATLADYVPPVLTNGRTLHAGNLDRNGYVKTPTFQVSPTTLVGALAAGEESTISLVMLTNVGEGGSIPFTARSQDNPNWLKVTQASGTTPGAFQVAFDARFLASGVYTTHILIESSNDQVSNAPLMVDVQLTVRPGLTPRSLSLVAAVPCPADAPALELPLLIDGPTGMTFVAQIVAEGQTTSAATQVGWPSAVDWAAAQSPNSVPATMIVTFYPQNLSAGLGQATLELAAADAQGQQLRRIPLTLLCAQSQLYLPLVAK
ncbi:MAG: VCBS repeat-containing protein [Caldilineaceae bacterium]|nr:VCBS repeat-containing protein [Caldilineaceae bacterium]